MEYTVNILCDKESGVWIAIGNDIPGLVLESPSYDTLLKRLKSAVPNILEANYMPKMSHLKILRGIVV